MFDYLGWRLKVYELFGGDLDPTEGEAAAPSASKSPRVGKLRQFPSLASAHGAPEWPREGSFKGDER